MPRSDAENIVRRPSQVSLLNSNEFAFVDSMSYSDEGAGGVFARASSVNDVPVPVGSSRPRARRRHVFPFVVLMLMILVVSYFSRDDALLSGTVSPVFGTDDEPSVFMQPLPDLPNGYHNEHKQLDPLKWLRQNSYVDPSKLPNRQLLDLQASRPKAALISLVRNSQVAAMVHTISQFEARFNSRKLHRYDWVFFNEEEFSEEFKSAVLNVSSSRCFFERIPKDHWSIPRWVDQSKLAVAPQFLEGVGTEKIWLESHHHMSRWNAGLFALESRLQDYQWYWRIEPGVEYPCNINYDVFRFMRDNDMAYGFNMAILDDARSLSSLWDRTKDFKQSHPDMVHTEADMSWALHTPKDSQDVIRSASTPYGYDILTEEEEHNNCQFYSNFEIGSLEYFRGHEHQTYFDHLDRSGSFYYEQFGDAPVHILSVKKLTYGPELDPKKIRAAELDAGLRRYRKEMDGYWKHFEKERGAPSLYCGHTTSGLEYDNSRLVLYTLKQTKPFDTCIRLWLGGKWFLEKHVWRRQEEVARGEDGYGSYLVHPLETNPFQQSSDESDPDLLSFQDGRQSVDNPESSFSARLFAWFYFVVLLFIVAKLA